MGHCIGTPHKYFHRFKASQCIKYIPGMMVVPVFIRILSLWFSFPEIPVEILASPQLGLTPSTRHLLLPI